jgi:two-component system sensor histidine kinase MprB
VTRLGLTLRSRIALLVAVTVGFAVALVALAAYVTMRMELSHQLDHSLLERADQVVALQQQFPQTLTSTPSLSLIAADVDLCFVSAQYSTQCTDAGLREALGSDGPELAVAQGRSDQSVRTLSYSNERYRVVAVPLGDGAALVLAGSAEQADATLEHLGLVLLLVGSIGVVFSAGAGLVLARAAVRPVERLTAAAEHVARTGELEPIDVHGHDELGRLAVTFNAMLAALEISRTRQRQLVADAGHELRTPLTSLRTNLDLLAQSEASVGRQLPKEDREALLVDVRAQAEELSGLVADLVELARDDAPSSGPAWSNVRSSGFAGARSASASTSRSSPGPCTVNRLSSSGPSPTCSTTRSSGHRPTARSRFGSGTADWTSPTAVPASRMPICRTSSTVSTGLRRPGRCQVLGSDSRSCARRPKGTAVACR